VDEEAKLPCALGITAHNEAANIGRLLERVLEQRLDTVALREIVVVASGCTDGTEAIARDYAGRDGRIRLLVQERREGKASAINLFMRHASEKILVLCSADVLPEVDAVEKLVAPLADPELGMTSCRPVPVDDPATFMGYGVHLLWELHHQINLNGFKAGEMTAFRKVFERIPYDTAVDEASVEPIIRGQGYRVRYVPEAVVANKGAETVADFLRQRRRIYAGHLVVRQSLGYAVSTMSGGKIIRLLLRNLEWRPKQLLWTAGIVALEVYGRFLGWRDYKSHRDHSVWEVAQTTKKLKTS
jgi:cellulose synthase/poly-beta-1,6-N-acetylglucosamine synthase-like glycosyltransferase